MHDTDTDPDRPAPRRSAGDGPRDAADVQHYTVDEDEPLDVAITYAIAALEGIDPRDVDPPLHDVVDPEALERLITSATGDARARFSVGRYDVTVADGGSEVVVEES